ncbi:hypothetical protein D3C71_2117110 [compost metagenome]
MLVTCQRVQVDRQTVDLVQRDRFLVELEVDDLATSNVRVALQPGLLLDCRGDTE